MLPQGNWLPTISVKAAIFVWDWHYKYIRMSVTHFRKTSEHKFFLRKCSRSELTICHFQRLCCLFCWHVPDTEPALHFVAPSIEPRESPSSSPSQRWLSSWMRPPRAGSTSTASRTTTAPTCRTSPWTSRRRLMSSWRHHRAPAKAWTCWGLSFFLPPWVSGRLLMGPPQTAPQ